MTLEQIAALGRELLVFLGRCFLDRSPTVLVDARPAGCCGSTCKGSFHGWVQKPRILRSLKPAVRRTRYEEELKKQRYYQRRNQQARASHTKTRLAKLDALGIDAERIKSCLALRR